MYLFLVGKENWKIEGKIEESEAFGTAKYGFAARGAQFEEGSKQ